MAVVTLREPQPPQSAMVRSSSSAEGPSGLGVPHHEGLGGCQYPPLSFLMPPWMWSGWFMKDQTGPGPVTLLEVLRFGEAKESGKLLWQVKKP